MYKKEKPINFKGSASAINNNLSVAVQPERELIHYAVVHKSIVNVISSSMDGTSVITKQIACTEQTSTASCIVIQAKIVKVCLNLICKKSIGY